MTTAILYARFSSAEQANGDSIARQTRLGQAYIERKGWTLENTLTDEGKSAFHETNRAAGSALHEFENEAHAGRHKGKILVVENLDRLSRAGAQTTATMIWDLNKKGVTVATFHDDREYRPDGDGELLGLITMVIESQMAHAESKKKQARTNANWDRRYEAIRRKDYANVRAGVTPSWLIRNHDGTYSLDDHRVSIMRFIYDKTVDGLGHHAIAKLLNQRGEKVWSKIASRAAAPWGNSVVSKLLNQRAVLGEYWSKGELISPDFFPPIIEPALFHRAHSAKKSRRKSGGPTRNTSANLLYRIAVCDVCDSTFGFQSRTSSRKNADGRVRHYSQRTLRCDSNRRAHVCTNDALFDYDIVEKRVLETTLHHIVVSDRTDTASVEMTDKIAAKRHDLETTETQIASIAKMVDDALERGQPISSTMNDRLVKAENRRAELKSEMAALEAEMATILNMPTADADRETIRRLLADIASEDVELRIETRRQLNQAMQRIVPVISFTSDGRFAFVVAGGKGGFVFGRDGQQISPQ